MRKALLSILGVLLIGELLAGHTKVKFYSPHGEAFVLSVNGRRINHQPAIEVYLDHLYPGENNLHIRVHRRRGHFAEVSCPIYLDDGYTSDYVIQPGYGRGYTVKRVTHRPIHRPGVHHKEYYYEGDRYHRGGGNRGRYGRGNGYGRGRGYGARKAHVEGVINSLSYYSFDRDKLRYAKNTLRGRRLYVNEVKRIMLHLSFDKARLEFASFAYPLTIDAHNYHRVKGAFRFRHTARELDARIYY